MVIQVSIDSTNLNRRLNRITSKLDKGAKLSVQETGRWTRDNIIQNMPKATGESAQSIVYRVEKMTKGEKEVVVTQGFAPHPRKMWAGKWFNVPFWMFDSPKALSHFKNGNIVAMRQVPQLAALWFNQRIRVEVGRAIK
jgi:hypothetical protein